MRVLYCITSFEGSCKARFSSVVGFLLEAAGEGSGKSGVIEILMRDFSRVEISLEWVLFSGPS